jgi:hypothetical protein
MFRGSKRGGRNVAPPFIYAHIRLVSDYELPMSLKDAKGIVVFVGGEKRYGIAEKDSIRLPCFEDDIGSSFIEVQVHWKDDVIQTFQQWR